jgi:hypothetical protein
LPGDRQPEGEPHPPLYGATQDKGRWVCDIS